MWELTPETISPVKIFNNITPKPSNKPSWTLVANKFSTIGINQVNIIKVIGTTPAKAYSENNILDENNDWVVSASTTVKPKIFPAIGVKIFATT